MSLILIFVILLPILLGIIAYPVGKKYPMSAHIFFMSALAVQFILALVTIFLCYGYMMDFTLPGWNISFVLSGVHGMGFRSLFMLSTIVLWFITGMFSQEYFRESPKSYRFYSFMLISLSGILGLCMAKDLITMFLFMEITGLCSYVLVAHSETEHSRSAANLHLMLNLIGSVVTLYGLLVLQSQIPSLVISELPAALGQAHIPQAKLFTIIGCLLFGCCCHTGLFPVHFLLPKVVASSTAPTSVLLSGVLSQTGFLGIIILAFRLLPGDDYLAGLLLLLSVLTLIWGSLIALLSKNILKYLVGISLCQTGTILIGIASQMFIDPGLGSSERVVSLGISGAILTLLNQSLFNTLLFICTGIICKNAQTKSLKQLRGDGTNKPWIMAFFLIGSLGSCGIPFFSGYISKTTVYQAVLYCFQSYGQTTLFTIAEIALILSSAVTIACTTRTFISIFINKSKHTEPHDKSHHLSLMNKLLLSVPAFLIILMGIYPTIMNSLATAVTMSSPISYGIRFPVYPTYFSWECLSGTVISLFLGIAIYFALLIFEKKN